MASKGKRERIWEQGQQCYYCKLFMAKNIEDPRAANQSPRAMTVEHLHPRSKGGTSEPSNLVGAHLVCNNLRGNHDRLPEDFVAICRVAVRLKRSAGILKPGSPHYWKRHRSLVSA